MPACLPQVTGSFDKMELIRGYKFCVAMENSITKDYITEKLWQVGAAARQCAGSQDNAQGVRGGQRQRTDRGGRMTPNSSLGSGQHTAPGQRLGVCRAVMAQTSLDPGPAGQPVRPEPEAACGLQLPAPALHVTPGSPLRRSPPNILATPPPPPPGPGGGLCAGVPGPAQRGGLPARPRRHHRLQQAGLAGGAQQGAAVGGLRQAERGRKG